MNRVVIGFIFSPLVLAFILSVWNTLSGESPTKDLTSILFGVALYALIAYFFTFTLALPSYLITKKLLNGKPIPYLTVSIFGFLLGAFVGALISGFTHMMPPVWFGGIGLVLSNIFWLIAIR